MKAAIAKGRSRNGKWTHEGSAGCSQGKSPMSSVRAVAMIKAWPRPSPSTHRFVKRLTENGFTEKQAGTLAEEHVVLLNANADVPTASTEVRQEGRVTGDSHEHEKIALFRSLFRGREDVYPKR